MRQAQGTASITTSVFLDLDADGIRDQDELDHYFPVIVTGICEDGPRIAHSGSGIDPVFTNVPMGRWWVRLDTQWPYAEFEIDPTTQEVVEVDVQAHDDIAIEFGVSYPSAAFIRVLVVADQNLNGEPDPSEPPVGGLLFCADDYGYICRTTSGEGFASLGPFQAGTRVIRVFRDSFAPDFTQPGGQEVTIGEGETAAVTGGG